eukprot:8959220-Lingulodinium_polyedra.AAC.1
MPACTSRRSWPRRPTSAAPAAGSGSTCWSGKYLRSPSTSSQNISISQAGCVSSARPSMH